jgi:ABC-2 type transport system ATP-binding protein
MIEVHNLVYDYPTKRALKGVSLHIAPGTITALVGPNGAGKSTLMRCIAALDVPYSGTITVNGLDTREHPRRIHEDLSFLPDFFGLYDQLSVRRCLQFAARAHGLSGSEVDAAVEKAAHRVGITDRMNNKALELSRGLRQRLAIGQAIVHEPKVILLDEPASGLDPDARRSLSRLFLDLKAGGITLIVSSHILSELEDYSTDMIIIQDGLVVGGKPVSLSTERLTYLVETETPAGHEFMAFLERQPGISAVTPNGAVVEFDVDGAVVKPAAIIKSVVDAGYPVTSFAKVRRTLEQTYLDETRKAQS